MKSFQVVEVASHLTPVPGGVGPMTVAMLMYNTVQVQFLPSIKSERPDKPKDKDKNNDKAKGGCCHAHVQHGAGTIAT